VYQFDPKQTKIQRSKSSSSIARTLFSKLNLEITMNPNS